MEEESWSERQQAVCGGGRAWAVALLGWSPVRSPAFAVRLKNVVEAGEGLCVCVAQGRTSDGVLSSSSSTTRRGQKCFIRGACERQSKTSLTSNRAARGQGLGPLGA
jgi:hypothetical protein